MDKKETVLKKQKISKLTYIIIPVIALLFTFLLWPEEKITETYDTVKNQKEIIIDGKYAPLTAEKGQVSFSIDTFDDDAQFFSYTFEDKEVRFFLLKSNDGVIRAAFDACDVCYRARKGYTQNGDLMICNNCGMQFPEDKINVNLGGCNPSPIERTVKGDKLIITLEELAKGKRFF